MFKRRSTSKEYVAYGNDSSIEWLTTADPDVCIGFIIKDDSAKVYVYGPLDSGTGMGLYFSHDTFVSICLGFNKLMRDTSCDSKN